MILIHRKSYYLLSISIILSFTILLVTLIMVDSIPYNKYKDVYNVPKNALHMSVVDTNGNNTKLIEDKLSKSGDYSHYLMYNQELEVLSNDDLKITGNYYFIDSNYFNHYFYDSQKFYKTECIYGSCELDFDNEIIIDELFYNILQKNKGFTPFVLTLPMLDVDGNNIGHKDYLVKGVVRTGDENRRYFNSESKVRIAYPNVYFRFSVAPEEKSIFSENSYLVRATNPKDLLSYGKTLGMINISSFELYNEAYKVQYDYILIKEVILLILFIVLGINVYGSFMNTLKDRYFEIGIKRAIGASQKEIMLQFFCEVSFVLLIDFIVALLFSEIILLLYKLYNLLFLKEIFIIYFNIYSFINYFVFSVFISILCCFIFSYKATKVTIIDILKSE